MTKEGSKAGCFISFEGIDGAGKSTHVTACVDWLKTKGVPVVLTREPGGSPLAERLRALLLHEEMSPAAETLLAFAAREDHLRTVIRPALAAGQWVVCDRFTDSTFAYQGGGAGVAADWLQDLQARVHGDLQPARTYLFDLPPEVAEARRAAVREADRFEAKASDYFGRVRAAYQARVAADAARFLVLDAQQSVETIRAQLLDDLARVYTAWAREPGRKDGQDAGDAAGHDHGTGRQRDHHGGVTQLGATGPQERDGRG